jgi:threonine/homoserine/homoserine lactone efflux protein
MGEIIRNILLGISLAAPLGPSGVAVIQNGLQKGFVRAFLTGLGVTMADATYLLIVFFGVSSFISIPVVKVLIWTLGASLLLYLGFQNIRGGARRLDLLDKPLTASRNPLLIGYLINISNPIAVIWWLGIYGALLGVTTTGSARMSSLLLSSTILVGILIWHSSMSLLTHWGRRFVNERTIEIISLIAGIVLALFGLRFAYFAISTIYAYLALS